MARGDAFIPGRVRTDRALSSRRRNARWASLAVPFVKVNPRHSAAASLRRPASWRRPDRLDAVSDPGSHGLWRWNWRRAQPGKRALVLSEGALRLAREALRKDRTAAKNRGKALTLSLLKRQNAQRLEQIDRQIATVEAAILQIVEADASLADRFAILISIPGVSNITAFALLIGNRRSFWLPQESARPPTSQAWRQSPDSQGVGPVAALLAAGAPTSAKPLHAVALVAARFNPDMKVKYAHLIQTGKPAKVALTAPRKLVVLANALLKANRPWTPKTA